MSESTREREESPRRLALRWLGFHALATALVAALFLVRYALTIPSVDGGAAWAFLLLTISGHSLFLSALALTPVLALALAPFSRKVVGWTGVAFSTALFLVLAVDSSVYRLYRFHLNGMVWELLTGGAVREILPMEASFIGLALALPLGALVVAWLCAKGAALLTELNLSPLKPVALFAAMLLAANVMHAFADAEERLEVASLARVFPANRPLTAKRTLRKLGWEGTTEARTLKAPSRGTLEYPAGVVGAGQNPSNLNVLVVFLDGWRQDSFDAETTPNLYEYAKRGQIYADHWSTGNATRFGVFGFFYGLHATYWHDVLAAQRPPVLIETARSLGYRFGIFASAPLTSPEFDRTVFSSIRDRIPLKTEGVDVVARDREITRRFTEFVDADGPAPFFSFLFYDTTHLYAYPKEFPETFTPAAKSVNHVALDNATDPAPIKNRLKNSYRFADSLAGEALKKLGEKGLLERTVVIITGDHGEEMNDTKNNFWGHNSAFTRAQSAVPFAVLWPGVPPGVVTRRTSHADVAPTLMRGVFDSRAEISAYSNGRLLSDESPRPFVIVSNWDSFALVRGEETFVSTPAGGLEALGPDYRRRKGLIPTKEELLAALKELGGFYRKGAK